MYIYILCIYSFSRVGVNTESFRSSHVSLSPSPWFSSCSRPPRNKTSLQWGFPGAQGAELGGPLSLNTKSPKTYTHSSSYRSGASGPEDNSHLAVRSRAGGLPWWLSGKESAYQCRRYGFDP